MINLELTEEAWAHVLQYQAQKKVEKKRRQLSQSEAINDIILEHKDYPRLKAELEDCRKQLQRKNNVPPS